MNRLALVELVESWRDGQYDEFQVHARAEELWDQGGEWPSLPEDHPDSIPVEVLTALDSMNVQLITREDIETILEFLKSPPGSERFAWKRWKDYWDSLDFSERAERLKENPFYFPDSIHQ